jgi:hypothetical protein
MEQSTIRAFQQVCRTFSFKGTPSTFSEDFAVKRYLKKMQEPDPVIQKNLTDQAWSDWITFDETLPKISTPSSTWYRVRARLHGLLSSGKHCFDSARVRFPKGSEFSPTRGRNSLEARLSASEWTCTYDNFDEFAKLSYSVRGLRNSAKARYGRWFRRHNFDLSQKSADKFLYERAQRQLVGGSVVHSRLGFLIFKEKLRLITQFEHGSRFSTVPKNNDKRRPINVECFGNTLTQSVVGEGIRAILRKEFSIDLDNLSDIHRIKVSKPDRWATIDLSNASDSVSVELCKFLFPKWFYDKLEATRSHLVLGLDGHYHMTKKISSMGNGFTFELMTLILTTLCKELDEEASVFGDDITIHPIQAPLLISLLTEVGFVVNVDKTFITGPFRESCGANYHRIEGYIKSFDFMWPHNIGDCVILMNKAFVLSKEYPLFRAFYNALLRVLPSALHGGPLASFDSSLSPRSDRERHRGPFAYDFPSFFITPKIDRERPAVGDGYLLEKFLELHIDPSNYFLVRGYEFKSALRTPTIRDLCARRNWAKYLMFLDAGRVSKDVLSLEGEWRTVWFVTDGRRPMRASLLKPVRA